MNACIINVWGYTEILPLLLLNEHKCTFFGAGALLHHQSGGEKWTLSYTHRYKLRRHELQ